MHEEIKELYHEATPARGIIPSPHPFKVWHYDVPFIAANVPVAANAMKIMKMRMLSTVAAMLSDRAVEP